MKKNHLSTMAISLFLTACTSVPTSEIPTPGASVSSQPSVSPSPVISATPTPLPTVKPSDLPSAQPTASATSPDQPVASSSGNPNQDLSIVKSISVEIEGKRYLTGEGQSTQLKAVLKDANDQILNSDDYPLEWLSNRPQDFSIDNSGKVVAMTDYGYAEVTLRLKGTSLEVKQLLSVHRPGGGSSSGAAPTPVPVPKPELTAISQIGGVIGNTLVLTGTHFSKATGVFFGNTPATSFTIDSDTQITATVPAGTGSVDLTVATAGGTSSAISAGKYTYTIASYNYSWPAGQSRTRAPNILNGTNTTFNSYSTTFTWNYLNLPFTVPVTGQYTFTATTAPVVNTSFILKGLFQPSVTPTVDPVTPVANFIVSNFAGNISTLTNIELEAGQQYTFLTAFNNGGTPADTLQVTITGPDGVGFILTPSSP